MNAMRKFLPENLLRLAETCPAPLYLVGGSVRDFLLGYPIGDATDYDLSSPLSAEEFLAAAKDAGFAARAVYRNTGTVKLEDAQGFGYEFSRFRSDRYVRGEHVPAEIFFTEEIELDARRRDFCANAVYYDIRGGTYVDPLGGIGDIGRKILRTVRDPRQVFGEDGLRLMRLARIAAELGFSPDAACLAGAKENAALIGDIAPERVFAELTRILYADEKHGIPEDPYRGLCLLRDTGVLSRILPELAAGEGISQRADFHSYDCLEHSLRCVRYAPRAVRFAALFHDVGKPYCAAAYGNFHDHPAEGERITREALARLKAPRRLTEETAMLVGAHMYDFDCKARQSKVRRMIVRLGDRLPLLLALKQADFSACKDDLSPAPTVVKWERELERMKNEGVPLRLRDLALGGADLRALGVPAQETATMLEALFDFCLPDGTRNTKERLTAYVLRRLGARKAP